MTKLINQLLTASHNNMSNVFRYSITRVIQRENLAEHSFYVSLLADLIAEDIIFRNPNILINREKILRYGLFHDFEEVVTGDMVSPPKYRSEILRKELEKVGKEMLNEKLSDDFTNNEHIKDKIFKTVEDYEADKYNIIENSIVKFADMLQSLSYSLIEYKSGNVAFKAVIDDIYNSIIKRFSNHEVLGSYCEDIKHSLFVKELNINTE